MKLYTYLLTAVFFVASFSAMADDKNRGRVSIPVDDVRLTSGSAYYHAQQMDIRYLLSLDPDRLLAHT